MTLNKTGIVTYFNADRSCFLGGYHGEAVPMPCINGVGVMHPIS